MKTLLITDRYSDSTKQSMMKIRKNITLNKSVKLKIEEIMPWIRISLTFDEKSLDKEMLMLKLRAHYFVAAEI